MTQQPEVVVSTHSDTLTDMSTNPNNKIIMDALVAEFGPGADLSQVPLVDIIDTLVLALLDAGCGEDSYEDAERIATNIESKRLPS